MLLLIQCSDPLWFNWKDEDEGNENFDDEKVILLQG